MRRRLHAFDATPRAIDRPYRGWWCQHRAAVVAFAALSACLALGGCRRQVQTQQAQAASPAATAAPDDVIKPYLAIHEGLAKDSLQNLGANAGSIADAARTLGASASQLATDATRLQEASTLADAREKFGTLSESLVSFTKARRWTLPSDVRQAYCPMVKKPWLQRGSMIANPYYGKEMPGCGEFK